MRTVPIVFFILSLSFLPSAFCSSQNPESLSADTIQGNSLLELLERKHSTTIFYKAEWVEQHQFPTGVAAMPIEEAIEQIKEIAGLNSINIDGMIFLLPAESGSPDPISSGNDLLVIGSPSEYGRYSRAAISGEVLDAATYEPLFGAVVYEPVTETGASTDFEGKFSLELPVGEYNLRISYVGYDEKRQRVRLISNGEVRFELFSGATQLDEFTIIARRAEDNISRTQMSMVSMDSQALKELPGSFGEQDIVRSFTMMPGVQTVGEFGSGFNVRGGSADQNLILVENVPLFNSSHLFGLISVINPDMVNNVTLMKAGVPAKYGERASAVMDVRLGNGLDQEKTTVEGGIGLINSRVLFETPIVEEKATFSLGARSSYSDWFLTNIPNEDLMNSSVGFYDISSLLNIAITQNHRLTLFGYRSFDRSNFGDDLDYEYFNNLASLRLNSFLNERLSSTFLMGFSNYQYQLDEKPEFYPEAHYRMNSNVNYRNLKWYFSYYPSDVHNMEFGINAIHYDIEPGKITPLEQVTQIHQREMEREQAMELSAFFSDEISLNERMALEIGLRYTHYLQLGPATVREYESEKPYSFDSIRDTIHYASGDIATTYGGLEPRLGFRYSLNEFSSVKLSYNRANQYINLISNTSVMAPTDLWKLSDSHLKPLKSDQVALGYFRNFMDNSLETSVEVYYKKLHNVIEYRSGAEVAMNDFLEMDVINAKGYNYGLELFMRKNSGDLTGWASYTYSTSQRRSQSPFPEMQINNNTYFPSNYDRPHNLTLNANYHLSRRWRMGATFTYNTGRPVTLPELTYRYNGNMLIYYSDRNSHRLPDYHRLDISITLGENLRVNQRGKGTWTFSLMNVYGRKNPFSVFYKSEPGTIQTPRSFELYQLYIIGRPLPTITYNFSF